MAKGGDKFMMTDGTGKGPPGEDSSMGLRGKAPSVDEQATRGSKTAPHPTHQVGPTTA